MWFWELLTLGLLLLLPVFKWRQHKNRQRKNRMRLGWPDAVDLTVICFQAGLSPQESFARVSKDLRYAHPELSDELDLASRRMRAGYSWDEALSDLSQRTDLGEMKILVRALVQAGPLGVVRVLRAYSDDLRLARQQQAEEHAAKTTIKILIPLVLFILPSIIFVTLGPAFIQLIRTFNPVAGH